MERGIKRLNLTILFLISSLEPDRQVMIFIPNINQQGAGD